MRQWSNQQVSSHCAVAIPTIPPRADMLTQAILCVGRQLHPVDAISVAVDVNREGAWATRQRALDGITAEWTFFLDDDDYFYPQHTKVLLNAVEATGADYVYSYYDTALTPDLLGCFGKPFNPNMPHHTTTTILIRTELAKEVGFTPPDEGASIGGEDWRFTLDCIKAGASIIHVPEMTWVWRHHIPGNTSGMPVNW